jgi:hypothetical protein
MSISGEEAGLTPVGGVTIGSNGVVMVGQPLDFGVRFFEANTGRHLGSVGRRGGGPGEFSNTSWMGRFGDRFWIEDPSLMRVTTVGPARTVESVIPVLARSSATSESQAASPLLSGAVRALFYDRSMIIAGILNPAAARPPWHPAGDKGGVYFVRIDSGGRVTAFLGRVRTGRCVSRYGQMGVIIPLCQEPLSAVSPDGSRVAFVDFQDPEVSNATFEVRVVDSSGRPQYERTFAYAPETIASVARDTALAALRLRANGLQVPTGGNTGGVPRRYAPVARALIGEDGTLWLERFNGTASHEWLIIDAKGVIIGELLLPSPVRVRWVSRSLFWATESDSDDVESLARYRIR